MSEMSIRKIPVDWDDPVDPGDPYGVLCDLVDSLPCGGMMAICCDSDGELYVIIDDYHYVNSPVDLGEAL